ncbi:LAMI_0A02718g1_1 [Lachancea mirantina]|uniref:LAMI_0A02718g1_1 n=1 Tax=Lachancea mirantina TaxID=1230905 RepID=A0A1G4IMR4_9SACH|nr:LAMI_0A02718g1_1 [Lachancea mirantina]
MELIQGFIQPPKAQSVDETIPTLCDRVENATLISDRRSAVLGLKAFSRDYRETVIALGLKPLINVLKMDYMDDDMVKAIMETLLILFIRGEGQADLTRNWIALQSRVQNGKYPSPLLMKQEHERVDHLSLWIADFLTQSEEIIHLFLKFLEIDSFHIQLYAIQILEAVVATRPIRAREAIISQPVGISTLVSMLDNAHEPVRDEAILLLMAVVNDNNHIQKLLAFQNIFERLFAIVEEEGGLRGSLVVSDCLSLIINILKYNSSNQDLFLEGQNLSQLARILNEPLGDDEFYWNDQRVFNIQNVLAIIKLTVDPESTKTPQHQQILFNSHILMIILRLAFFESTPNSVRPMTLLTAADIVRDDKVMQESLRTLDVPYFDPTLSSGVSGTSTSEFVQPLPDLLLGWALLANSVHTFELRKASLELLKAYLYNNHDLKEGLLKAQIQNYKRLNVLADDNVGADLDQDLDATHQKNTNVFQTLLEYDPDIKLNPYKLFFVVDLLLFMFSDDRDFGLRKLVQNIQSGDQEAGEEVLCSIQTICELLVTSLSMSDPRISFSYLSLLIFWLFGDTGAVNDFLLSKSVLNTLITYSSHLEEGNITLKCLATMLLGVAYEFSLAESSMPREKLYNLMTKSIGRDNYYFKIKRLKDDPLLFASSYNHKDESTEIDETGLPKVYFSIYFQQLVIDNFYRILTAMKRSPDICAAVKLTFEELDDLQTKNSALHKKEAELTDTIAILQQNLKELAEQFESSARQVEKNREQFLSLEREKHNSEEKLAQITKKHEGLTEEMRRVNAELDRKNDSLKDLQCQLNEAIDSLRTTEKNLELLEKDKTQAESGVNKLTRELMNLSKEQQRFTSESRKTEKELRDASGKQSEEIKSLRAELSKNQKKLKELEELKSTAIKKSEQLAQEKLTLEKNLDESHSKSEGQSVLISKLTDKLKWIAGVRAELEKDHSNLLEELAVLKAENEKKFDSLNSELQSLEARCKAQAAEIHALEGTKSSLQAQLDESLEKRQDDSDQLSILHQEVSALSSKSNDFEKVKKVLDDKASSLASENEGLKNKIIDLHNDIDKSKSRISDLESKISLQGQENHLKTTELSDLKATLQKLNSEKADQDDLRKKLAKELDDATNLHKNLESQLQTLTLERDTIANESSGVKGQLSSLNSEIESTRDELVSANDTITDLTAKLDAAQNTLRDANSEIAKEESKRNELERRVEDAKTKAENQKKVYEALKAETLEARLSLEQDLSASQEKLREKTKELEMERKFITENSSDLAQEYSTKVSLLEGTLKSHQDISDSAAKESKGRIVDLEKRCQKTSAERESLNEKLIQSESKVADINKKLTINQKKLEEVEGQLQALKKEHQEIQEVRIKALEQKQKESERLSKEVQRLKDVIVNEKKSSQDLNGALVTKDREIESLRRELESISTQSKEQSEKNDVTVQRLENQLRENDQEKAARENHVNHLSGELNDRDEKLRDLEAQLQNLRRSAAATKHSANLNEETLGRSAKGSDTSIEHTLFDNESIQPKFFSHNGKIEPDSLESSNEDCLALKNKVQKLSEEIDYWKQQAQGKGELDDLLLLVSELDSKNSRYRQKLLDLDVELSSEGSAEEEDDEDDD